MKTPNYRGERLRRERDQKSKKQERLQRLEEASAKRKLLRTNDAVASKTATPPGFESDQGA